MNKIILEANASIRNKADELMRFVKDTLSISFDEPNIVVESAPNNSNKIVNMGLVGVGSVGLISSITMKSIALGSISAIITGIGAYQISKKNSQATPSNSDNSDTFDNYENLSKAKEAVIKDSEVKGKWDKAVFETTQTLKAAIDEIVKDSDRANEIKSMIIESYSIDFSIVEINKRLKMASEQGISALKRTVDDFASELNHKIDDALTKQKAVYESIDSMLN